MKKASLLVFLAALLCATTAYAQETTLLSFTGYDYEDPGDGGTYLAVGDGYKSVGFITSVGSILASYIDFSSNENTYYLFGLTVTSRFFDPVNNYLSVDFGNGGRVRYFEDAKSRPGYAADYGTTPPPNPTSPSTFIDPNPNNPALGGVVNGFHLDYFTDDHSGGWSGAMTLDEGYDLIYVNPGQRSGWLLGGVFQTGVVPSGYDNQVEGNCRVPATPTNQKTWGA